MKRIAVLILGLILTASAAFAETAIPDTLDIYGGPGTLEGKFQTEAGEPDTQGWIGVDDTAPPVSDKWNVSTIGAANLDPGVPGNHAWFCGQDFPACSAIDSAWGYGNYWNTAIGTARTIDPTTQATVDLTGIMNFDLEPGYDFVVIEAITAAGAIELIKLDGRQSAYGINLSHTWMPGDFVGETADEVQIRLHVMTDDGWSDADCSYFTAGAVQADNLSIAVSQPSLPPYPVEVETCEPGQPLTWEPVQINEGLGNFAQLWTGLDDMDPDQDNLSPQWAFINDGEIVPELGPTHCWDKCYGPDSLSVYYGSESLRNSILSPPIALPADWTGALHLAFDSYSDPADCYPVLLRWAMQATDDPAGVADWTETWYGFLLAGESPAYVRWEFPVDQTMVPPSSQHVRIRLQAYHLQAWCWGPQDSPAPYLDNVRLQLVTENASGIHLSNGFRASAGPNPFNPSVVIYWSLPQAEELEVSVYDVRGRIVKRLRDGSAAAGPGQITWGGRDDTDQSVAAGVYFCRIKSVSGSQLLKLTLLK